METRKTKLALTASALAMALMLAGCGGGGSGGTSSTPPPVAPAATAPTEPTEPTEPMAKAVDLPAEMPMDYMAPTAGKMSVAAGTMSDPNGDVVFSCPAGGEDCEIEVMADGSVTSTGGAATAALTAGAMTRLEAENNMMAEEMTGRANGVAAALASLTTGSEVPIVKVSRKTSATAEIKSSGYTEGGTPTAIGMDWDGRILTKTNTVKDKNSVDMITVYSDIDAPALAKFGDVYGANPKYRKRDRMLYITNVGTSYTAGVLTLAGTIEKPDAGRLDSDHFPQYKRDGATAWTYGSGSTDKHPKMFKGTFHGAEGEYKCTDTSTCSVTANADGTYTLAGTAWQFTPALSARVAVQDVDYLQFGYWLQTPDDADKTGDYSYMASMIATGSQPFRASDAYALSGSAKYNGSATGLYAVKTVKDGVTKSASHGSFLADVNLTVAFSSAASQTAFDDSDTVEGRIDNFRSEDGADMADWSVGLNRTMMSASGATVPGAMVSSISVSALMGAEKSKSGSWSADLHGSGTNGAMPTGITGQFSAAFENANIAGAFGARKQ